MKRISGYVFNMNKPLGKGSYGLVFYGEQESTKKKCAIKVVEKKLLCNDEYLKNAIMQEMQILSQVRSPNIVEVYDVMESSKNYYIIQELCDSDLDKYMKHNPQITEKKAIQILKQIVNGFIALVKQGIIHRDLKPANILLKEGEVKIGDFGFAKRNTTKKMIIESHVGTPLYMSVQLLKGEKYTSKCDVWAIGFIFYELLHNNTPWIADNDYKLIKNIQEKPLKVNKNLDPDTKDFLAKTLAIQEKKRASWDDVFDHPIFNGYFDKYRQNNKQIENKFKVIMSNLRFQINSKNIDIGRLLETLNLDVREKQLDFSQFEIFMRYLDNDISGEQVRYFFDKVDQDNSGTISVKEIESVMSNNQISTVRTSNLKKADTMSQNQPVELGKQLEAKVKKCFLRLYRVLNYKKISLKKTFEAYDQEKQGNLTFESFKHMINRLDSTFSGEDTQLVFNAIDLDHSNSIQFQELNSYYCKVNGIPATLS